MEQRWHDLDEQILDEPIVQEINNGTINDNNKKIRHETLARNSPGPLVLELEFFFTLILLSLENLVRRSFC